MPVSNSPSVPARKSVTGCLTYCDGDKPQEFMVSNGLSRVCLGESTSKRINYRFLLPQRRKIMFLFFFFLKNKLCKGRVTKEDSFKPTVLTLGFHLGQLKHKHNFVQNYINHTGSTNWEKRRTTQE